MDGIAILLAAYWIYSSIDAAAERIAQAIERGDEE